MAFKLDPKQPIRHGLKVLVRQQLKRAEQNLREDLGGDVHEARKRVKKVRAVVVLVKEAGTRSLAKDERRLRAAGRTLSALRDADALIATFDHLRTHFPKRLPEHTNAIVRRRLVEAKTHVVEDALADQRLAQAADALHAIRRSVKRWDVPAIDAPDLPNLIKAGYRVARKAMRRAHEDIAPSELHRWRKRVKTLWYQMRMAEPLAPDLRDPIRRFKQLERWLGEAHNLSLLQATIGDDRDLRLRAPKAVREVMVASRNLQTALRRKAFDLGNELLRERPKAFARDLRRALSSSPRKAATRSGGSALAVA
jgi:CHAD domain-containing protein